MPENKGNRQDVCMAKGAAGTAAELRRKAAAGTSDSAQAVISSAVRMEG